MNKKDLKEIKGGGIGWGIALGIAALCVLLIGALDGFTRPLKCDE